MFRQKPTGAAAYLPNDWRVIPASARTVIVHRRSVGLATSPTPILAITRAERTSLRAGNQADPMATASSAGLSPGYAVLRPLRCRCCLSNFETARSVSLTCSVLRNSRATSGSRTTTLVPSAYLAACLPRTPLLKSYSGRIVSMSSAGFRLVCFFIAFPFSPCWMSRTYDSNLILALCVRHHEQLHTMRHADIDKAIFRIGVTGVRDGN